MPPNTISLLQLEMSIGSNREVSQELKTKELVDLAGLSLLPLHVNLKNGSKLELSDYSLNNNSVIVTQLSTVDAWVVGNIMECNIMPTMESVPNHLIPINPEMDKPTLAENHLAPKIPSQSLDIKSLLEFLNSKLLTILDPWPLPVMPVVGLHTLLVSSPTVEDNSITPSYLLDILTLIGSSKTHGVLTGENLDISDF